MNTSLWKKALKLALKGRLWLLPIDAREEVGISLNSEHSITMVYPDRKHLEDAKNERGIEATIIGHYLTSTANDIGTKGAKDHFEKWFRTNLTLEKKGNKK